MYLSRSPNYLEALSSLEATRREPDRERRIVGSWKGGGSTEI